MAITIPELNSVSVVDDTDNIMLTHSNGNSEKISGAAFKADMIKDKIENNNGNAVSINAVSTILATSTTITGPALGTGGNIKILFTSAIAGVDTSTGMSLTYNGDTIAVKVGKDGALEDFKAVEVSTGVYRYLQAYTTLELVFDGTYLIIVGNPVVLSSSTYTYFADGLKRIDSITNDDKGMVTSDAVYKKTKDLPQVATTSGVNLFQIKSIAANSSNVSINGYHFVSGIMFITINGLGTVILKYAAQATNIVVFDILTTPNVLTASIVNYQGLLKYNGNTILKLYRTSDSDIKIDNVNAIVIRTDYCSL